MATITGRNQDADEAVLSNAIDFLNAGLNILFAQSSSAREAKVGVVAIQTAIELLAKYRLVKEKGIRAIVRGVLPSADLLTAARSGSLRTIGYGECLKAIRKDEAFTQMEEELVDRVQQLRNSLVHFAAEIDVHEVRMDVAWLLIRALAMFAAGHERDQGEMQTHARFLDPVNFSLLINFKPYRDEAVDSALDSIDSVDVLRCWECEVDAMSVRPSDTYFCHCCGLTADLGTAEFVVCALCEEAKGVCFDPLNQTNDVHHGRCLHCKTFVDVVTCKMCGVARSQTTGAPAAPCLECLEG